MWVCYFKPDVLHKEFDLPANLEPVNILIERPYPRLIVIGANNNSQGRTVDIGRLDVYKRQAIESAAGSDRQAAEIKMIYP